MKITCTQLPEYEMIGKTYEFIEKIVGKDLDWSNMKMLHRAKGRTDDTLTLTIYEYNGIHILEEEERLEGMTVHSCGFEQWGIDYFVDYTEIKLINS